MDNEAIRLRCLELAIDFNGEINVGNHDSVIKTAKAFYDFVVDSEEIVPGEMSEEGRAYFKEYADATGFNPYNG